MIGTRPAVGSILTIASAEVPGNPRWMIQKCEVTHKASVIRVRPESEIFKV